MKKAEALLAQLRRLEEAASDPASFIRAARKLYPELYERVAALRDGDLKTDISTAVALYDSASRAGLEDGSDAAPDCAREMRELYARLCREASDRAGLFRAKARAHARMAEAELLYARGERGEETLEAVSAIRAERATDRALAEEALYVLEGSARAAGEGGRAGRASVNFGGRLEQPVSFRDRVEQLDRILASLPRDRARRLLNEAREAFRDGLYWQTKAAPARALVVDANAFSEARALQRPGLRADEADLAALANLGAALKFISKAKEELATMK